MYKNLTGNSKKAPKICSHSKYDELIHSNIIFNTVSLIDNSQN